MSALLLDHHPILTLDEIVQSAADEIMRKQTATRHDVKRALHRWIVKAANNERRKCVLELRMRHAEAAAVIIDKG